MNLILFKSFNTIIKKYFQNQYLLAKNFTILTHQAYQCNILLQLKKLILRLVSCLDAFSNYLLRIQLLDNAIGITIDLPEIRFSRSSRTKVYSSQFFTLTVDRDQTVSRRSKLRSCTAFLCEQQNPWNRLQLQDAIIQHRGAKPSRRQGLQGMISLLSPAYLLFVER